MQDRRITEVAVGALDMPRRHCRSQLRLERRASAGRARVITSRRRKLILSIRCCASQTDKQDSKRCMCKSVLQSDLQKRYLMCDQEQKTNMVVYCQQEPESRPIVQSEFQALSEPYNSRKPPRFLVPNRSLCKRAGYRNSTSISAKMMADTVWYPLVLIDKYALIIV